MPDRERRGASVIEVPDVSRRRFLQQTAAFGATAAASGFLVACGGDDSGPAKAGTPINLLTWETYDEPQWVKTFTKKTGIKVNVTEAGSVDEMYAKARSGSDWDIIVFDSGSIPRYRKADLIAPLDPAKIANVRNITPSIDWRKANNFDGQNWAVPYNWGTQPLMYDTTAVSPAPTTWGALWDPKYKGKVVMFDDSYIVLPMIALYVGAKDPYNLTDPEWEKVRKALKDLRPQVRTIATGFDDAVTIYAQGDGVIGYCQNVSIVADLNSKGKKFAYTFPTEGTPLWIDNSVITKRGARKDVYEFINNAISVPWQVDFINFSANNGILTEKAAKQGGVKPEVMKNNDIITQTTPGFQQKMSIIAPPESVEKRLEVWNEFKAGV